MAEVFDLYASMTRMEVMLRKMNEILDRFNGVPGATTHPMESASTSAGTRATRTAVFFPAKGVTDDVAPLSLPLPPVDADSVSASVVMVIHRVQSTQKVREDPHLTVAASHVKTEVDKLRGGGDSARAAQQDTVAPLWAAPASPPKASSSDFVNMFRNYDSYGYDNYYYESATAPAAAAVPYMPSQNSWEVCEKEGILDLEEDGALMKEVAGQYSAPGSGDAHSITVAKNVIPASFVVHDASASGLSSSASPALATT